MRPKDYILTDERIKEAYIDYIKTHERMPTQQRVADICNISRKTVNVHLNNIDLHEIIQPFKIFGGNVLMGLRNKASKGDAQAAKLFFMLVYDYSEKQEHKIDSSVKIVFEDVVRKKDANNRSKTH